MDNIFKLYLLLSCLRITCCYFQGDEHPCKLSELGDFEELHIACNCMGEISKCDLPEKYHVALV